MVKVEGSREMKLKEGEGICTGRGRKGGKGIWIGKGRMMDKDLE